MLNDGPKFTCKLNEIVFHSMRRLCTLRDKHIHINAMYLCIHTQKTNEKQKRRQKIPQCGSERTITLLVEMLANWWCPWSLLAKKRWCIQRMRSHTYMYALLSVFILFYSQRSVFDTFLIWVCVLVCDWKCTHVFVSLWRWVSVCVCVFISL